MRALRIISLVGLLLAAGVASANAQTTPVVPGDRLGWNQPATSLAEAQGYTYLVRIDVQPPVAFSGAAVTCIGTESPFLCSIPFPSTSVGVDHEVTVAARKVVNGTNVDSPFANPPLVFQLVVVPGTPINIRRISGD